MFLWSKAYRFDNSTSRRVYRIAKKALSFFLYFREECPLILYEYLKNHIFFQMLGLATYISDLKLI